MCCHASGACCTAAVLSGLGLWLVPLQPAFVLELLAGLWRLLDGKLPDASRALIEERLKYTDKQLTRAGLYPGYRYACCSSKCL